jgi:hypothetical protein
MIHLPFQAVNHRSHQAKTQESNFQSDALAEAKASSDLPAAGDREAPDPDEVVAGTRDDLRCWA